MGQLSVTMTDHGNMFGALDFYDAAIAAGVKPFIGQEFYQARKTRFDKDGEERASGSANEWGQRGPYHCGIVAYNNTGYHNLMKLSSRAFTEGYFVKPRVDHELLAEHHEGLVMFSGCLSGEIQQALLRDDFDFALATASKMQDIFGRDNYFIEVQRHGIPEEDQVYPRLLEIAHTIGAPIVATCDSHYTHQHDANSHDVMLCQPPGTKVKLQNGDVKNIEDIEVGDTVASWNPDQRRGFISKYGSTVTKISQRHYDDQLVVIQTYDGKISRYTKDHICIARLDSAKLNDKYVVYMMRRGTQYRIGVTKYKRANGKTQGISFRAREQGADAMWILSVHTTQFDALVHEALAAFRYNIPTWQFFSTRQETKVYEALWPYIQDNTANAAECLAIHGRDIKYPLWTKETKEGLRRPIEVRACNLIDGMTVCVPDAMPKSQRMTNEGSGAWQYIVMAREAYNGVVYSIDVDETHTYIADGIVTHNCVNTGSRLDTPDRFRFSGDEFYLKSYDEMCMLFPKEYVDNTMLIHEKHDIDLKFGEYHFPHFPLPDGYTADSYFEYLVYDGARRRFGDGYRSDKTIMERLEYEISVIIQMGFPNYFLVVADIVNWAKDNGILVGLGRGSAAGSLASFCMRITEVNPLEFSLPFERFLVPGRKSMPDIDLDFDDRFRQDVIEYTRQKYGHDHTAHIATFNKIGAKKAVRDAARVLGYDFEVGDKISKVMPPPVFGVAKSLAECMETEEFAKLYQTDDDVRKVIDTARNMEGLIRETGMHAAGLVVADKPITDYVPVMQKGEGTPVITQYDMTRMEQNGLLKIDFLGLRNLSIVDMCIKNIKETKGDDIDIYQIPKVFDQKTFDSLSRGENVGVFQVESTGIKELLVGLKPSELEDLVAILALYRPGPMGSNVHNEFVDRKHKRKPVRFLHPSLKDSLSNTFGLLLYQEQLLSIARNVAGFDVGEADDLRKVVGKKQTEKMPKFRAKFIDGCVKTVGMDRSTADQLFKEIEHHASYSFSKNHSVPYGLLSYITAYLRVNYPVEYMAAALSTVQDNEERLRLYLEGSKALGLSVLPPSINYSEYNFAVKSDTEIVYGFSGITGIGGVLANKMVASRDEENYKSLFDFMRRVDVDILNKKIIEHFTASGCFDELIHDIDINFLTKVQKIEVLRQESEELGIFLTDHPLTDIYDLVVDKVTHSVNELDDASIGNIVRLAGVVVSFTKKMTKRGKKMYKLKLEDMTDSIYIDIFAAKADQMDDEDIQVGDILIVEGRPARISDDENSTISLRYNNHEKIDIGDSNGTKPIFLHFNTKPYAEQIKKLHDIIEYNEGMSSVFLIFKDKGSIVKLKLSKTTNPGIEEDLKRIVEVVS